MDQSPSYVELFCRTNSSFLVGASQPQELVDRSAQIGLRGLAITDRNGVYAIPKAYLAARSHPSLQLLIGCELVLDDHPPLRLISMDRQGYGLMCRILTASHLGVLDDLFLRDPGLRNPEQSPQSFKKKGQAGISWADFLELLECHPESASRLILLPDTLCSGGLRSPDEVRWKELRERFDDRLYLPLARLLDGCDRERTDAAIALSQRHQIPIVAVNDVHYHEPSRRKLQDILASIKVGKKLSQAGSALFSNSERYLKTPVQMARLFRDRPDAIARTVEIASRCKFDLSELRYQYPSEWIPEGQTAQSYLEDLTWKGATWRYGTETAIPDSVRAQLRHELQLIEKLRYADYFLTIWDIVEFAKSQKILCQGRGSAANSAVCFVLGITAIDPVKMNLLFERFISMERNEPPDIDVDFEAGRREEVIQYVYQKYGRHRAGMVAAVVTYRSRLATREISKVLEVPLDSPLAEPLAEDLYGFPRHLSIHSGGFTLSRDPLIETVPIEPARMEGRTIVQWDKNDLETIGLLKVDLLALGMLSALKRCFDLLGDRHTLASVPRSDSATWAMIQKADTIGVFQIESRAQMGMLPRLKPREFYDLVVQVAIVRPGPIVGKMVHPYLKRRRGEEPATLPHPALEPILGRTLGVPIFQEQVMKMAMVLAGFSPGEADELRRAIGAWKSTGPMQKMGIRLRDGLLRSGLPPEYVDRIFEQILGFSEYGFPESHAASFAHLSWVSSYLKCHHPAEFTCSLINSQPMGFYSTHTLVDDARRHGVRVLPVDPQLSNWECEISEKNTIQLGWNVVRGMGESEAIALIDERKRGGAFLDLADLIRRTRLRPTVLHHLALGDTFRCFDYEPREALWEVLALSAERATQTGEGEPGEQLSFALEGSTPPRPQRSQRERLERHPTLPQAQDSARSLFRPMDELESVRASYRSFGLSTTSHPMRGLRQRISKLPRQNLAEIRESTPSGRSIRVAGLMIVRQRPPTAKGTSFGTLEDETGLLDLIFHREVFEKHEEIYWNVPFVVIEGRLQRDGDAVSLIVQRMKPIFIDEAGASDADSKTANSARGLSAPASRTPPIRMQALTSPGEAVATQA